MDLKCMIKLLDEKEIIKVKKNTKNRMNGKTVMTEFKYPYDEVYNKIKESEYDETINRVCRSTESKCFLVINKKNLVEAVHKDLERYDIDLRYYNLTNLPASIFISILKEFGYHAYLNSVSGYTIGIKNLKKIQAIQEQKEKEKQKVLDFINQLP